MTKLPQTPAEWEDAVKEDRETAKEMAKRLRGYVNKLLRHDVDGTGLSDEFTENAEMWNE